MRVHVTGHDRSFIEESRFSLGRPSSFGKGQREHPKREDLISEPSAWKTPFLQCHYAKVIAGVGRFQMLFRPGFCAY